MAETTELSLDGLQEDIDEDLREEWHRMEEQVFKEFEEDPDSPEVLDWFKQKVNRGGYSKTGIAYSLTFTPINSEVRG